MPDDRNWFIAERSEALATLMLTAIPDVSVQNENEQDDGVDLLVARKEPGKSASRQSMSCGSESTGARCGTTRSWAQSDLHSLTSV